MLRRKTKKRKANPIHMPKSSSKSNGTRVARKKVSLFKKKNKGKKSIRRKGVFNSKLLIIPVFLLLFGGLIYISAKYIFTLRDNAFGDKTFAVTDVIGLQEVPEYPGSVFIFADSMDSSIVKEFLSTGSSSYRLPNGTKVEDIENYYKEELPQRGWELVSSIPLGTEDREYGQYWVKEGKGLRVYTKFKDVWYQTVSEHDARTALADKVKEEIEREMLMASSEKQDLLPDFPWKIQIPKQYLIRYEASEFKDFRAVNFQKIGTNDEISLYPSGYYGAKELDYMLEDYCEYTSDEENDWKIQNTVPVTFKSILALRGTIIANGVVKTVAVIPNTYNNVVYVLSTNKENDPLFEYVFENVKTLTEE